MSVDYLLIKNFQAHPRLEVRFGSGVNTIIGPSDIGKSTIVRALRWIVLNSPPGESVVRWGSKGAAVRVGFEDSISVTKIRKHGEATYRFGDRDFKSFGSSVPPEVANHIGMGELNFQYQHDSPFWLSDAAGEVARQLNSLVNLEIIDVVESAISGKVRESSALIEVLATRIKSLESRLDLTSFVGDLDNDLRSLEEGDAAVEEDRRRVEDLGRLVEEFGGLLESMGIFDRVVLTGHKVLVKFGGLETLGSRVRMLADLIVQVRGRRRIMVIDHEELDGPVAELQAIHADIHDTKRRVGDLARIIIEVEAMRSERTSATQNQREAEVEFENLMGEVCKLCGQTIRPSP